MWIVKIEHLKEFYSLSEFLNFTQTAEHLFITQPALSNHIALMEKELGTQLLRRTTKSVELTQAGAILRDALPEILEKYESVIGQLRHLDGKQEKNLRIGLPAVAVNDYLGQAPTVFRSRYPEVSLSYVSNEPEDNIAALLREELDLIVIAHIPFPHANQLTFYDYLTEPLVVICKSDDPLARKGTVSLADLKDYTFLCNESAYYAVIWEKIKMECRWAGFTPKKPLFFRQMDAVLVSVRQGLGITIVGGHHRTLATQGLGYAVLEDKSCMRKLSNACKAGNSNPYIPLYIETFAQYGTPPLPLRPAAGGALTGKLPG